MNDDAGNHDWKIVKEIFHEALRHRPADRDTFLNEICGDDVSLRIEVESLLISLTDAKSFLEEPAFIFSSNREVAWQFRSGEIVSHYRIVEPIGAGGMGQVYLAEDQKLHRRVALKILPHEVLEDVDRLRRFKREAMAVSALNHPNILTIFDFDDADGVPLLASEYVKGNTLRERLKGGQLDVAKAIELSIQIGSALQSAHEAGVIHRDIKPENIMIRDDGYVKILDFGLAKLTGDMRSRETDQTRTQVFSMPGMILGTATYMSPEQARSSSIDARTDIFSFGIVLYEMLAGRAPFSGETTTDIIAEIIQKEPPSASVHNSAVPEGLDRIINKCLEKDREDRYQTSADLLADLRRCSARGEKSRDPIPDSQVDPLPTQRKVTEPILRSAAESTRVSRSSYWIPLAIIGAVLTLGLAAGYYLFANRDLQIDSIAVMPFTNGNGNADVEYLSDGMTESLINALSSLPNLSVKARNSVFRYKGADIDQRQIAHELSVDALVIGRITQRGDSITLHLALVDPNTGRNLWGEQYDRKMEDLVGLQREITRDVSQKLRTRLSNADASDLTKNYTPNSVAYQDYLRGRYFWNKRTPERIAKAIEYFDAAIAKDPQFALAYAGLADSYVVPMNQKAPRDVMPKAKAAALRALEIDDSLAEAHTSLARVLQVYEWNWKEAEKEFKRAIELNPRYAVGHQWYGGYLEWTGRLEEAVEERRIALELDPLSTPINFDVGQAFYLRREYDKALEQFRKTLELDPSFSSAVLYTPLAYSKKGMHEEAIASLRQIPDSNVATAVRGYVLANGGREQEARQELAALKRHRAEAYISAVYIAYVHAALGENEEALAWLEQGYEERAHQMQFLKVEPRWDKLRSDPRFADVVRRIGFPE